MIKICTNNSEIESDLTIGKTYEIEERESGLYYIISDRDTLLCVSPDRFN